MRPTRARDRRPRTGRHGGDISEDMIFYPYVTRGCRWPRRTRHGQPGGGQHLHHRYPRDDTALTVATPRSLGDTVTIHAAAGVQNNMNNYGLSPCRTTRAAGTTSSTGGSPTFAVDERYRHPPRHDRHAPTLLPTGTPGACRRSRTPPPLPSPSSPRARLRLGPQPPRGRLPHPLRGAVQLDNRTGRDRPERRQRPDRLGLPAGATNLGNIRCFKGTFSNTVGTAVERRHVCAVQLRGAGVTLDAGESALLTYQFDFTPAAAGTFAIANVPAAPAAGTYNNAALGPNSATWAQFSRFPRVP